MIELIGVAAGSIGVFAAVPEVMKNHFNIKRAANQSIWRNILTVTGNSLWVIYGYFIGDWPIMLMCGINVALNLALCAQCTMANSLAASPQNIQNNSN